MVLGWSVMNFGLKYHSYAILFLLIMICSFLLGCLSCKPLFVEGKLKNNCQSYRSFQRPVIWSVTSSCAICHLLSLFFLAIKAFLIEMITCLSLPYNDMDVTHYNIKCHFKTYHYYKYSWSSVSSQYIVQHITFMSTSTYV